MFHDNMTTHWPNSVRRSKAAPKILVNTITGQARLGRELNTTAKVEPDQAQKGPYVGCKATHAGLLFSARFSRL